MVSPSSGSWSAGATRSTAGRDLAVAERSSRGVSSSRMTTKGGEVLFAWLHLSDIHVGHGDVEHGWDQKLVLEALRVDVARVLESGKVPQPRAVLVTGDVAFSGATRKDDEYECASRCLDVVGEAAGLTRQDIFVIPGNHDVQRNVDQID